MLKKIKNIGKKVLSILLAIILVMSVSPMTATAVTTNEDGYIEVSTIEDLYNIRNDLTANYILMNDIDLTEATAEGGDWDFEGRGWNPIGSEDIYSNSAFSGTFDGNGKTIKGMRIDVTSTPSGTGDIIYAGLFANVTGSIHDLALKNVDIYVYGSKVVYAGSLAGNSSEGNITNVKVEGVVDCKAGSGSSTASKKIYVGGMVGSNSSNITGSSADVKVDAEYYNSYVSVYAGGLAGRNTAEATIQYCYSNGEINGIAYEQSQSYTYSYVGGIAAHNEGVIKNCYNTGSLSAVGYSNSYAGAICAYGTSGQVSNCYNIGAVSSTSATYAYAIANRAVTSCYYLQGTGVGSTGATALTQTQLTLVSMYKGFDFTNTWTINAEAVYPYPQLISNPQDLREFTEAKITSLPTKTVYEKWEELDMTGCVIEFNYANADTEYITVTADMVTGFDSSSAGEKILTITYEDKSLEFTVTVNEKPFQEIYTVMDLYNIRYNLEGNYILMNDIDLTEATAEGGDWDFEGRGWNPIGSEDIYSNTAFKGIFNGNGHSIKGMRIDVTSVPSGVGDIIYIGLFANVSGTVRNLTMENVNINAEISEVAYAGSIAGKSEEKAIINANVIGEVNIKSGEGESYVGGLIGYNNAEILNSSMNGNINAAYGYNSYDIDVNAGGIAGYNVASIVSCYTKGTVTAKAYYSSYYSREGIAYAGGIAGESTGKILNCYNTAEISALEGFSCAGGICGGLYSKPENLYCYNVGKISSTSSSKAYAIASAGTITDCYYLQGTGVGYTGATALTETQMLLETMYAGFDFESVWVLNPNANYPYPQLKSKLQDVRVMKEAKIYSLPDKVVYTKGETFDATGLQLVFEYENADTEYVDVTSDMVTGFDSNTVGKQTLSTTYYDMTFTFDITVNERPFVEIYTVADLYNVRNDLTLNYILMNDIDLTEATAEGGEWDFDGRGWNPIGSNDVYSNGAYSGIFDGNGHTIKGMRIDMENAPSGTQGIYVGLFANVTGEIRNLHLSQVDVYLDIPTGRKICAGGITAYSTNATIDKCSVKGEIYAKNKVTSASSYENIYVGGIAGYNDSNITHSYTQGTIAGEKTTSSSVSSLLYAGGIAGYGTGEIANCYNTAQINATGYRAYASGINYTGTITNCYNIGETNGAAIAKSGTTTNCYYLAGTGTGITGATSLTDTQLKLAPMYSNFDFENVWTLNSYANYPYAQLRGNVQDLNETVELIRVISYPTKTDYLTGDEIDLTGAMFEAIFISGKTELLEITSDMISGYDPTLIGEQTLTVTYGRQTDSFTVNVARRPEVTGIELVSEPTARKFVVGTVFDFSGAKVKVFYDNGTSEELNVTEDMTTGGNINHIAMQTITVVCGTYSTTFVVEVVPATVLSISVVTLPSKLVYMEGQDLDMEGMKVMATYSNGTSVQIKSGYTVTGYSSEPGTHEVTVEFAGQKASFEVTVNEKVLSNIEIKANPDKTDYVVGEALDLTGLVVVAAYENGDLDIITGYTVSGYDGTPGSKVITLTYGGKTAAFIVNVVIKCVTKLEITKQPIKVAYIENEALNVDGMIVEATYNDGEVRKITDYDLNGFSSLPGTHTVYVSYEGQVDSFEVNVTAKVLSDLRVTLPQKTAYIIGEEFDSTGLDVVACYNNGQEYSVENYLITGFDSRSAGAKEIQISYGGMTRSFVITVTQKSSVETGGAVKLGVTKGRLGESVQVPVSITKNTGLSAFCHTITFDATDLAFKKATLKGGFANGTMIVNDEKAANGEITVLWFQATDVIESGVAYVLDFGILETATDGVSDVSITFDENDNGNASGENVIFETINGSVEVLSYWLGDLDGNRTYEMLDLLQLAQYVSGKSMTLTEKQKLSADVNEDGVIDIHDVTLLSQWLLSAEM